MLLDANKDQWKNHNSSHNESSELEAPNNKKDMNKYESSKDNY